MYCKNCGRQIADNSKFCNNCGAVQQNQQRPGYPQNGRQGYPQPNRQNQQPNRQGYQPNRQGYQPQSSQQTKKQNNSGLGILIGLIAVLLLFSFLSSKEGSPVSQILPEPSPDSPVHAAPDGWTEIRGETYYYKDGEPVTGLWEIDGESYYFDVEGKMLKSTEVKVGDDTYHTGEDGKVYGITYARIPGDYARESYRMGNGGTSTILEMDETVRDCQSFDLYLEAEGLYGAKVNGEWVVCLRLKEEWKEVARVDFTQPDGTFHLVFDEPVDFEAITCYPTVRGNASYSSGFGVFEAFCFV